MPNIVRSAEMVQRRPLLNRLAQFIHFIHKFTTNSSRHLKRLSNPIDFSHFDARSQFIHFLSPTFPLSNSITTAQEKRAEIFQKIEWN